MKRFLQHITEQSEEERRAERNKANDPFELYPDYGDAEPSVHRARDARDRGLKNLEKRQARNIPRETLGDNTPSRIKSTKSRIESGKMIPASWTTYGRDNKDRPRDEYGFTDTQRRSTGHIAEQQGKWVESPEANAWNTRNTPPTTGPPPGPPQSDFLSQDLRQGNKAVHPSDEEIYAERRAKKKSHKSLVADRVLDRAVDVTATLARGNPISALLNTQAQVIRAIRDRRLGVGQDIGTDEYEGRRAQGVQDRLAAGEQIAPPSGGQVMGMRATSPEHEKRIEALAKARPRKNQSK